MHRHAIRAHASHRSRVCPLDSKPSPPVAAKLPERISPASRPAKAGSTGLWSSICSPARTCPGESRGSGGRGAKTGDHGCPTAPPRAGSHPSFASRQPECRRRLPHDPAGRRHRAILSRTANRWDNAPRESCFRTLKTTLVQISGF